ncbi:hypothetical protein [Geothrix fuzhouensis]|nr:hypothetical protein [Geothrix fuzhouensis]
MKESLPEGLEVAAARTDLFVPVVVLPATPPEDGADPDQYLWGV